MIPMIGDLPLSLNELSHALCGPDIALEAEGLGSLGKQSRQLCLLLGAEARRGASGFTSFERLGSLFPGAANPLADGSRGDAQGGSDVGLFPALLEEFPGTQATTFLPMGGLLGQRHFHTATMPQQP